MRMGGEITEPHRLPGQRKDPGDHRLRGDHRRHGCQEQQRHQRPFRREQEEGVGNRGGVTQQQRPPDRSS